MAHTVLSTLNLLTHVFFMEMQLNPNIILILLKGNQASRSLSKLFNM